MEVHVCCLPQRISSTRVLPARLVDPNDKCLNSAANDSFPVAHTGVARLADPNDKYLVKWVRAPGNPV
jgi:hypothetical protein